MFQLAERPHAPMFPGSTSLAFPCGSPPRYVAPPTPSAFIDWLVIAAPAPLRAGYFTLFFNFLCIAAHRRAA